MQLKLRAMDIMCVVNFSILFCFHDKFIVYYRYCAQFFSVLCFFLSVHCCWIRVSTGVIKGDVNTLTYLHMKYT